MPSLSDFSNSAAAAQPSDRFADLFGDLVRVAPETSVYIDGAVHRATVSLGRGERALWYLRLFKVGLAENIASQQPEATEIAHTVVADYARRAGITEMEAKARGWHVYNDDSLLDDLESLLRLPIPAVRSFRFGARGPDEVLEDLRAIEKRWRADAKDAFADPDAVEVLRFDNGLAWYDLKRETCALEAEAMGHHGNGGREGTGDTILSLRHTFDDGKSVEHKPLLSFVLDKDGFLGETKGPFGEKPEQRYHAEIVALLRLPIVRGIKGGGTKPETNFTLSDLSLETADELRAEKPELTGLSGVYETRGIRDPMTLDLLRSALRAQGIEPPMMMLEKDRDVFVIERWRDAAAFFRSLGDGTCAALASTLITGSAPADTDRGLTPDEIASVVERMDVRAYGSLMRVLGLRAIPHGNPSFPRLMALAAQRIQATEFGEAMEAAVHASLDLSGADRDALSRQLSAYAKLGFAFTNPFQIVKIDADPSHPVSLTIRADDLVGIAVAEENQDEDYLLALHDLRQDGWFRFDETALGEKRTARGLSPEISATAGLESDPIAREILKTATFDPHKAAVLFTRETGV